MTKLLVVVGPTAIGKSDLAIKLAKAFNGEIINGDSVQVYKYLNIGSAKTTDQKGIVHHLLDYKEPNEDYNVAIFQKDARAKIEEITNKGKLPIIVGGTGLYIKALLYDYNFAQQDDNLNDYHEYTTPQLFEMLQKIDIESSEKIHQNNRKRIIRALQIADNGQNKSTIEAQQKHQCLYDAKIVGLTIEREKLRQRIDARVDQMIQQGLVDEVISLFNKYETSLHCFSAIGYKEFIDYFYQQASLPECIENIKTHTKQFAKRQYTWFNHQMNVDWYDIEDNDYYQKIEKDVNGFINE